MEGQIYFFDTYAVIEIIKGNPHYDRFKDANIILTQFNIAELYYSLLRGYSKDVADILTTKYLIYVEEVPFEVIQEASAFKLTHLKTNMSGTDAIGYVMAKRLGVLFLTGDEVFRHIDGVEFVK